ncbi:MAG TPA: DUF2793 domain-containing protein [Hellea balneolensis]|uniref:DUF2793 domain-containing protein n=1 Tax=Hellea balneolensis TaxID=287478 RepID=A0A7C5LZU3_9PROT|nr:DUF2793 domain-containing protein [Hellea balneolensis]
MTFSTTILDLPFIAPAQAQKHVTHNEALQKLDVLIQLRVLARDQFTPPPSPADSDAYIVPVNPTGVWAGETDKIAIWQANGWQFFTPNTGWLCWVDTENLYVVYRDGNWQHLHADGLQNTALLGVNATADTTNRLSTATDNVLFNHETADIRVKLNKNTDTDTASFIFQSGWTGHAEIGLSGDTDFHFKVSPDGTNWKPALTLQNDGKAANFNKSVGIGFNVPTSFWAYNNTPALFCPLGFMGSNGSYEHGLWWNGYRNSSTNWTSLNINNYTSAAGISLGNTGIKFKWQDPPTGAVPADIFLMQETVFRPASDNYANLGSASQRWKQIYAASGTINTSDGDYKTEIKGGKAKRLAEKRAAQAIKQSLIRYQFNSAIKQKGKRKARVHFGAHAQRIEKILQNEGLNPDEYGFLCKDKLDPPTQTKTEIYGLRYDELMMFILYYQ